MKINQAENTAIGQIKAASPSITGMSERRGGKRTLYFASRRNCEKNKRKRIIINLHHEKNRRNYIKKSSGLVNI